MNSKRIDEMAERVASVHTASSADIVGDHIEKAIAALSYIPTSYAYPDKRKSKELHNHVNKIRKELEDILDELPVPVKYVAYVDGDSLKTTDVDKLVSFMKKNGHRRTGYSQSGGSTHKWLWNQPVFDGMAGPVGDGPNTARYDTWAAFDMLTR
jgi:hypothetical protein